MSAQVEVDQKFKNVDIGAVAGRDVHIHGALQEKPFDEISWLQRRRLRERVEELSVLIEKPAQEIWKDLHCKFCVTSVSQMKASDFQLATDFLGEIEAQYQKKQQEQESRGWRVRDLLGGTYAEEAKSYARTRFGGKKIVDLADEELMRTIEYVEELKARTLKTNHEKKDGHYKYLWLCVIAFFLGGIIGAIAF